MSNELTNSRLPQPRGGDLIPVTPNSDIVVESGNIGKNKIRESTKAKYQEKIDLLEAQGFPLPCTDKDLIGLVERMLTNYAHSTLVGYISAVKWYHSKRGLPDPDKNGIVQDAMEEIKIKKDQAGVMPKQAAPLVYDDLVDIHDMYVSYPTALNQRNMVICMLMYFAVLRRSELVAITKRNLWFSRRGLTIKFPITKNNKNGIFIERNRHDPNICVVSHLEEFIEDYFTDEPDDAPIFRSCHSSGRSFKKNQLPENAVSDLIKSVMEQLGSSHADKYSGHSPRRGYVTDAVQHESNIVEIGDNARMSVGLVKRYAEVSASRVTSKIMKESAKRRRREKK